MSQTVTPAPTRAGILRRVLAVVLDLILVFGLGGWIIAGLFGGRTENGFSLEGGPAFLLFALVVLYFVVFTRFLGGTLFQRLLGVR